MLGSVLKDIKTKDDEIEQEGTAGVERMNNHDIDLPGDDDDE
jgi:hypothetical protein